MSCASCQSPEVEIVAETGGIESGPFLERYECQDCGATGAISGQAEDPRSWSRYGPVFQRPQDGTPAYHISRCTGCGDIQKWDHRDFAEAHDECRQCGGTDIEYRGTDV